MTRLESRATVGLRTADARPRIPGPIRGTTIHYNGPPMGLIDVAHERCRAAWRDVQAFHMDRRGWSDVAYTMAACPAHGILMAGRGAGVRTAANGTATGNDQWYAIMALLGQGERPTAALYRAIVDGAKMLDAPRLVPHSWHKPTGCPGDPLRAWIDDGAPAGAGEDDDMVPDGDRMKDVQEDLNWIGAHSTFELGGTLTVDGVWGPNTSGALDRFRQVWALRARDDRPNAADLSKVDRTIHEIKRHDLHTG